MSKIFTYENITLINADCMEVMADFGDGYFDLAVVDPPYGIGECASRNNTGSRPTAKWRNPAGKKYKPFNDNVPFQKHEYDETYRVSKNQIIFGANNFDFLPPSTGWIVWDKLVSENEHLSMCELAYTSFPIRCKKFTYLWAGFKRHGNNQNKEIRINHPTQKPVALYYWILENYANAYEKIIDPYGGSFSSAIAAYRFGCKEFIGIEKDPDYFQAAVKRFKQQVSQLDMFRQTTKENVKCEQLSII